MLTKDNEYMQEVTKSLFNCKLNPQICKQCQDWEFEQKLAKMDENYKRKLKEEIVQLEDISANLKGQNSQLQDKNSQLQDENARLKAMLEALTHNQN